MTNITPAQVAAIADLEMVSPDMVSFGDVARDVLGQQCQYASYYVSGIGGRPRLTADLRVEGDAYNYHSLSIHKDDVVKFVERVNEHRVPRF